MWLDLTWDSGRDHPTSVTPVCYHLHTTFYTVYVQHIPFFSFLQIPTKIVSHFPWTTMSWTSDPSERNSCSHEQSAKPSDYFRTFLFLSLVRQIELSHHSCFLSLLPASHDRLVHVCQSVKQYRYAITGQSIYLFRSFNFSLICIFKWTETLKRNHWNQASTWKQAKVLYPKKDKN